VFHISIWELKVRFGGKVHKVCHGTEFWAPCVARQ